MKSRTSALRLILAGSAAALLAAPSAQAATYYWDDNAAGANFGTAGASTGTWAAPTAGPTAGWSLSATGADAFAGFTTGTGDTLNFGNGATGLAAGTITVGTVSAGDITFASGSGAIVLSGGTITLAAAQTTTVNNASDTINSILAGAGTSFTKAGTGNLILTGANTYTGTTTINAGTLTVGNGTIGSLNGTTGTALTFTGSGGTFNVNEPNSNQGMGLLTLSSGAATIQSTFASTGAILTFSNVAARTAGATANFVTSGGTNGTTNKIVLTQFGGGATPTGTLLDRGIFFGGTKYATYNVGGYLEGFTGTAAATAANVTDVTGTFNYDVAAGGTLGASASVNTLRYTGAATGTMTLSTAFTTNGILNAGSGQLEFTGGKVTSGTGEMVINAASGNIFFATSGGGIITNANGVTFNVASGRTVAGSSSGASITGSGGVTKLGAGILNFRGASSYTGPTTISEGTITAYLSSILGNESATNTLIFNGGTLQYDTAIGNANFVSPSTRSVTITSRGGTIDNNSASFFMSFAGNFSGAGALTKTGIGNLILSGTNTYTGATTVSGGLLTLSNSFALQNSALDTTASIVSSSATTGLKTTVTTLTFGGLSGNKDLVSLFDAGAGGYGSVTTLTLNPVSGVTATYSGAIANGAMALTKTGAGTQILSGANTYTGTTSINRGTLTVNTQTGSLSTSSAISMGGGTFNLDNTGASGALTKSYGSLTFSSGDSTVNITRTVDENQAITFSSLATRVAGATGNFVNTGGTNSATNGIILTGVTADAPMGPGYFFNGGTTTANYAFYNAATSFVRGLAWTGGAEGTTSVGGALTTTAYRQSTGSTTATIATGQSFTGLNFQNTTSTAQAVNITGAITTNGILRSGNGAGITTISNGTSIATTTGGVDLVIRTDMANDALTITTPIIASGASGLTKSGAGTLVLGGANTYTGQTYVNAGTLQISSTANLGATGAQLNLAGATLRTTGSLTLARPIVISNGVTFNTDAGTTLTIDNGVTGNIISGTGGFTKTGTGTMTFFGTGNTGFSNGWTGGLTVNGGAFIYNGLQTLNGFSSNSQDGWINTSNVLTLGDATFTANGAGARFNLQSFAGLNLSSGDNAVATTSQSGMTLNLNAISRTGSGVSTLNVSGNGVTTTTTANTNGILGPWATFGTGASTRYATGAGTIAGLTGTTATDGSGLGNTPTANYALAAGGGTVPATVSANTIRYSGAAGTTAPGATLFQVNGLLNAGTGTWTIGSGALTIGSTNQLVVNTASAGITVSASIAGGASTAVIKTNTGTLTLSGDSSATYSGTTYLYNGTLSLGHAGALGTGSLVIGTPNSAAGLSLDSSVATQITTSNAQTWNTNFTFVGTNSLDLGAGTVTLTSDRAVAINANTLTVGPIAGSGFGLTKTGNGILALSSANTYTGNTTVTDGGLSLKYLAATSKLSDTGVLSLTRVAVTLDGTASHAEVVGSTTLNAGASSLVQSVGATATLRMNAITRNVGGTINFVAASIADTDTSNTNGILGGWATVGQNTWAVSASSAADTAITGLADATYNSTAGTTDNFDTLKAGSGITLGSGATVNSIRFARAGADTVTAVGANIIGTGGILVTSAVGNNALTITGGTSLTSGNGQDLIVHQYNTANTLTIATKITGAIGVTETGPGTLILGNAANDYTGQTTVNGGTLQISSNANLGAPATGATLILNGATLRTTGNISLANTSVNDRTNRRAVVLSNGVTMDVAAATTLTVTGTISGIGGLTKTGAGTLSLGAASTAWSSAAGNTFIPHTFTGGVVVNAGTLFLGFPDNGYNVNNYNDVIASSNSVTLAGASLTLQNTSSRTNIQTLSGLGIISGDNTVTVNNGNTSLTLAANAITRSGGGTLNISYNAGPSFMTTTTANTNSILGPWAFFGTGASTKYATGAGTIAGLPGTTAATIGAMTDTTGVANYDLSATVNATAVNNFSANTVRYTGSGVTISSSTTGGMTLNGILNAGTGTLTIQPTSSESLAIGTTNELVVNAANNAIIISAPITGGSASGGFTKTGTNAVTISSTANAYTGGTTINAGSLILGAADVIPDTSDVKINTATATAAILNLNGNSETIGSLNGSGSVTTASGTPLLTIGASNVASATFSGVIQNGSGTVALTKTGTGTQILTGANTYTGLTTVSVGTLEVGANNALGTNAAGTSVTAGATLKLTGVNYSTAEGLTINGTGVGGTAGALASSGTSTFAGLITAATSATINAISGTLELSGGLVKNGTTLTFTGAGAFTISSVISGASANSDLVVDATTVTLTAVNTYNGPTEIKNGGILNANILDALPLSPRSAMSFTGSGTSTLSLGANQVVASLASTGAATVTLGSNTLTVGIAGGNTTFAGSIGGAGNLIKDTNSTQVLSGTNAYTGTTTVSAGTLEVQGTLSGTTAVTVSTGGTLLLNSATGANRIVGDGNITPSGTNARTGNITGTGANSGANYTSNGGTLAVGGGSVGTSGNATSHSFNQMTLTGNSIIDFSSGTAGNTNVNLFFASMNGATVSALTGTPTAHLTINNWASNGTDYTLPGTTTDSGSYGDGQNRLIFANDPGFGLGTYIPGISFTGFGSGAIQVQFGTSYEIVPVPEPATTALIGSIALCALIGYRERRRFTGLGKRTAARK